MAAGNSSDMHFEEFDFDSVANPKNFIDKGSFGEVYGPFTWNDKECALKQIWISQSGLGDDFQAKVEEKRNIWTSLKHKNLIEMYSVILRPKVLYIVMEYASGGSLLRCLLDNSDGTYCRKISNWVTQIAEGVLYLHEANIVHRDLKPNNIMLSEPFDPVNAHKAITLKITDFDDAKEHGHTTTMSFRGTIAYMAPEVLLTERFSKSSDIWSFGVMMCEMLTRKRPHEDLVEGETMQKAMSGQLMLHIPESVPESYKKLLHGCLHNDKDRRLTIQSINDQLLSIQKDERDQRLREYEADPILVQTVKTKAAEEEKKGILGFTVLSNELFIVSGESSEVEVYDSIKFSFSRRWNLKELFNPQNIASCNRNNCLYLVDVKGDLRLYEIIRVDPNGKLIKKWSTESYYTYPGGLGLVDLNGKLIKKWPTESYNYTSGLGLSVTDESNVILSLCFEHKINEYSPDGQLIREISAGKHWYPWHAIKLTSGHFMVSNALAAVCFMHRVCKADANGTIKKSFGGEWGSTIRQMNTPVCLAVDENGFVMVADQRNSRVLLLDSALNFKREILSKEKHGLRYPRRIILHESSNRLFVIDNNSEEEDGQILIFEFI